MQVASRGNLWVNRPATTTSTTTDAGPAAVDRAMDRARRPKLREVECDGGVTQGRDQAEDQDTGRSGDGNEAPRVHSDSGSGELQG